MLFEFGMRTVHNHSQKGKLENILQLIVQESCQNTFRVPYLKLQTSHKVLLEAGYTYWRSMKNCPHLL